MKRIITFALALLVMAPATVFSQSRPRTTKRKPTRATAKRNVAQSLANQAAEQARSEGATKVADQIKILTRFIYLLGGVTKGIEAVDAAARRNEVSPAVIAQTENSKKTVKTSLQNVREGLDQLEMHFRTTPELESYYLRLAGVAAGAAKAEDLAARNQFDQAGRTLLDVVNRLTDVLLGMR
jgi:hypothetical protein